MTGMPTVASTQIHLRPLALALLCLCVLTIPAHAATNRDAVAVIIGNKTYQHQDVPTVDFAHNDAEAMKRFVIDVLGYRERNIIDLRDATQAQLTSTFGKQGNHKGKLWSFIKEGKSEVTVFYSGHGVPGLDDQRGYLLPANADPATVDLNGYPVDVLYENLAKLPAQSVTVYLDACFSGQTPKGALVRATSGLSVEPRPPKASTRLTVLTAARGDQVASWDEEAKQGLFTRYLLEALRGAADGGEFGDGDGVVSVGEVKRYLDEEMSYAAKRRYRRTQTATVMGDEGVQLAALVVPSVPIRREKVAPIVEIEEMDATYVALKTANLRAGPGTGHAKVGLAATDSALAVTGRVKGTKWLRVAHAGDAAFVFAPLASEIDSAELASWRELGRAPGREKLEAHLKSFGNGHFAKRVQTMLAALPEPEPAYRVTLLSKIMQIDDGGVVIRAEPDGGTDEVGRLAAGESAEVTGKVDGRQWYRIALAGGRSGFAFGAALTEREKVDTPAPKPKVQPVVGVYPKPAPSPTEHSVGEVFKDCEVCPEMVVVPAGEFMMGTTSEENTWAISNGVGQIYVDTEKPRHLVSIGASFAVGRTEVTVRQFRAFVKASTRSIGKGCWIHTDKWQYKSSKNWRDPGISQTEKYPVVCINWDDANTYVEWLREKTGKDYRLLSEAEWEYVTRAGTTTYRYWGDDKTNTEGCKYANVRDNPTGWSPSFDCDDGYRFTSPSGQRLANSFGLYDTLGGVWEWIEDCWKDSYVGAPQDGTARKDGNCADHLIRGGSWSSPPAHIRSAFRQYSEAGRWDRIGFRVARTLSR
jgi:formylglycine-generating enzyme required for sulfatase activity